MTIREYYTCYIMTCFLKIRIVDHVSACIIAKNNFKFFICSSKLYRVQVHDTAMTHVDILYN